jgi:hypothetical protein
MLRPHMFEVDALFIAISNRLPIFVANITDVTVRPVRRERVDHGFDTLELLRIKPTAVGKAGNRLLRSLCARRFPPFDCGEFPTGAATRQRNRLRESRVGLGPAPQRCAVDTVTSGKLYVGQVSFRHH